MSIQIRKFTLSIFLSLGAHIATAQNPNSVVFTAGKQVVTVDEFQRQFLKNLNLSEEKITAADIDEYLDLYIKFKLKLQDAQDARLDSAESYTTEMAMYRDQLARNYLYDKEVTDKLIKEAYNRMQFEVSASHILITIAANADPKDTLIAYKKMLDIYNGILAGTTNFEQAAKASSEDPGTKENGGNLGYFTALQLVYPFENMAYGTRVGQISPIFRTQFGYHIIKVNDMRKNRGEIRIQHIMLRPGKTMEETEQQGLEKISDIHNKLMNKEASFETMALKFSDDFGSKYKNGVMDYFSVNQFVGDLDKQTLANEAFALQHDSDISKPFRTSYGWHIVKRLGVKPVPPFDQIKGYVKNQVQNDERSKKSVVVLIDKIKTEEDFQEFNASLDALINSLDTNFAKGNFRVANLPEYAPQPRVAKVVKGKNVFIESDPGIPLLKLTMFNLGHESFGMQKFAEALESSMTGQPLKLSNREYVADYYTNWKNEQIVDYQNRHLDEKNGDFRNIYQEYKEGILMFNRQQALVWDKANTDTVGLENFYVKYKNEYMWKDRFHFEMYFAANENIMKTVAKQMKKSISPDSILVFHNKTNKLNLDYKAGKFELSDGVFFPDSNVLHMLFDGKQYKKAKNKIYTLGKVGDDFITVKIVKFLPAAPKTLNETRGPLASRYQEHLEKQWLDELAKKYKVTVNQSVVQEIKSGLVN